MHHDARRFLPLLALLSLGAHPAFAGDDEHGRSFKAKPDWLGDVRRSDYDGASDDLLTAGLGKTGLGGAAPAIADPAHPTPAELRRLAIYNNYRALIDYTAKGGFGVLYGPNIDSAGQPTLGEGKIAGSEYLAFASAGWGGGNVTLMVQVPASFNPAKPCVLATASSGSRGIYGAIAVAEWGLKRGCAVSYTDRGAGNGGHELDTDTVTLIDGTLATGASAGNAAQFRAPISAVQRQTYAAANPFRYAYKHAHSQRNPEKDWGRDTLRGAEFALWVLNQWHRGSDAGAPHRVFRPGNTLVIAASVSNGGRSVLVAAEQDREHLIDGVVAGEPQIHVPTRGVHVSRGGVEVPLSGKQLYDVFTIANLYQPCAAIAPSNAASPLLVLINPAIAAQRCTALTNAGLLTGASTAEQAEDAKARLHAYGWEAESDLLHASHYGLNATMGVAVTYANAYSRASALDNLCGYSFATTGASGAPAAAAAPGPMSRLFATGNGVPPTAGINIVTGTASNGPIRYEFAQSTSTGKLDYDFDGAMCLRALATGHDANAWRLRHGVAEVAASGDLHGTPTIIVHGRSDALVPVNHNSRAYLGANRLAEGHASRLSYVEVTNANHFDTFLPVAGYDNRLLPLHYYAIQALDAMWAHLTQGAALPDSQVVHTTPRGGAPGAAPAISSANLPAIQTRAAAADRIVVVGGSVNVPD